MTRFEFFGIGIATGVVLQMLSGGIHAVGAETWLKSQWGGDTLIMREASPPNFPDRIPLKDGNGYVQWLRVVTGDDGTMKWDIDIDQHVKVQAHLDDAEIAAIAKGLSDHLKIECSK